MKWAVFGGLGSLLLLTLTGSVGLSSVANALPPQAPSSAEPAGSGIEPIIIDARIGEHPDRTRFVVEISDPIKVRVFTLSSPDRVVIALPAALWRVRAAGRPSGDGVIQEYHFGAFGPEDSRFVVSLTRPVAVAEPLILPPQHGHGYRVIVDLLPTTQAAFARAAGWPADLRSKEFLNASLNGTSTRGGPLGPTADPPAGKRVIVVDAGHGGIDSGTRAYDGQMEKDLVLDEAIRLGKALARRGYEVHLTRNEDLYIPLQQRVDTARAYRADLFISLHADSNPDPRVFGASVYTLSAASSDAEAAALARKENQSDIIAGVDLGSQSSPVASILIGLEQRDTINRSVRFADVLVPRLQRVTDILPRAPHRSAGFVVLKALDVPAVLIELGYLSNPADCARMADGGWRNNIATAIADAVDRQFQDRTRQRLSAEVVK
jgi:N-acetylmuramoyl-L-alanine amidase